MGGPVAKVADDVLGINPPKRPAPAPSPRPAPAPTPAPAPAPTPAPAAKPKAAPAAPAAAKPAAPVAAEPDPRKPRAAVYGGGVSQEDPGQASTGKKRRRTRTIMTGSGGVLGGAPVEKKTLLGQ